MPRRVLACASTSRRTSARRLMSNRAPDRAPARSPARQRPRNEPRTGSGQLIPQALVEALVNEVCTDIVTGHNPDGRYDAVPDAAANEIATPMGSCDPPSIGAGHVQAVVQCVRPDFDADRGPAQALSRAAEKWKVKFIANRCRQTRLNCVAARETSPLAASKTL